MIKLIDRGYKGGCCHRAEHWAIDTDAEVSELPKAPPGSTATSAESGITFYNNTFGEWPTDPSKYQSEGGGGATLPTWEGGNY